MVLGKCSNFLLLHVAAQFFQHRLLKRDYLFPLCILASFVKDQVPICAWIIFGLSVLFHWSILLFLCQYHTVGSSPLYFEKNCQVSKNNWGSEMNSIFDFIEVFCLDFVDVKNVIILFSLKKKQTLPQFWKTSLWICMHFKNLGVVLVSSLQFT